MSTHKAQVLRCYRELVTLTRRLPAAQVEAALAEARSRVRANAAEPDLGKASDMLKEMVARIGYLRMVTPRRAGDRPRTGASRYVFRAGKLEEGNAAREKRVADGKISMEEAWTKHNQLMRRQYFGQDPPKAPGIF